MSAMGGKRTLATPGRQEQMSIRKPLLVWAIYTFIGPTIGVLSLIGALAAFGQAEWFSWPQTGGDWAMLFAFPIAALFFGGLPAFATGMVIATVVVSRGLHLILSAFVGCAASLIWAVVFLVAAGGLTAQEMWPVCAGIAATGLVAALACGLITLPFRSSQPPPTPPLP